MTACATDVRVFVVSRALAALGGQGIQLAQQIIIAGKLTLPPLGPLRFLHNRVTFYDR